MATVTTRPRLRVIDGGGQAPPRRTKDLAEFADWMYVMRSNVPREQWPPPEEWPFPPPRLRVVQ
jgi:hypothetical protein